MIRNYNKIIKKIIRKIDQKLWTGVVGRLSIDAFM